MEAQGYRSLSLPEKGFPFLNYPNETWRGGYARLLVALTHALLAYLSVRRYRRLTPCVMGLPSREQRPILQGGGGDKS